MAEVSVSLLTLNGKPPVRISIRDDVKIVDLRAMAAAAAGFPINRTKLVYDGRPLHDNDGPVTLKNGSTVLVASAPVAETLGDAPIPDGSDDSFRLDSRKVHPRALAAARGLVRRGVPEWLLAAVLSIRARTWAILAMWLVAYRFTIMHGWGAVFVTTSGFVFIASNLGTRKAGEASAYSIFNEGFQQIAGTFGAEHMDAQLRQGRLG